MDCLLYCSFGIIKFFYLKKSTLRISYSFKTDYNRGPFISYTKASLYFVQSNNYIMQRLKQSKSLIAFDDIQCQCFQTPILGKQYFLSKNQMSKNLNTQKSKKEIPQNIQQALTKASIKRSLKRLGSPPRTQTCFASQRPGIDQRYSQKSMKLVESGNMRLLINEKASDFPFQATKIQPKPGNSSYQKLYCDYNSPLIQYNSNSNQLQKNYFNINPENSRLSSIQNTNSIKKIETSKISFNFTSNVQKLSQSPFKPIQLLKAESMKNLNPIVSQQMRIPRLERKYSKVESSDLGFTQTLTKHSIIYSGLMKEGEQTQIDDKTQTRVVKGTVLIDFNEQKLKNQSAKVSQTTNLKPNIFKSIINTKRSLLSETNRSKIVAKKDKVIPLLSKMQDVEEIRSLADSDEEKDSDKESVVLGRFKDYNQKTTIMRSNTAPTNLQQSLHFIQNQNSIIMDSPSGEWKYEAQNQHNY